MPVCTAVGASPLIGRKSIKDELVVWGLRAVGASCLFYFVIPRGRRNNVFVLVALGSKVFSKVVNVGSPGNRQDGYLWRVPIWGGGTRSADAPE